MNAILLFFLLFAQFQTMKGRTLHDCADTTIKNVAMDAMLIAVLVQSINYSLCFAIYDELLSLDDFPL